MLISLLIGSVNDINIFKENVPDNILDKVKQKIILFDGDETRFIYQEINKKCITIQGLSGTGKTELLLHKLKEIYVDDNKSKIMFTCHNKILADSLRRRIPDFFNFMKVDAQIKWNERLWCVNAWGAMKDKDSGAYSYICRYYGIEFRRFSYGISFGYVCKLALNQLSDNTINEKGFAFNYMLIDESQDFPDSFLDLCEKVTEKTVYISGDIFQRIFNDGELGEIKPDFLLSKCYRTDPKTLMFAHAIGMGLFETPKLRWLKDYEWESCGYLIEKKGEKYIFKREPLRKFEDLQDSKIQNINLITINYQDNEIASDKIKEILRQIRNDNPTVLPDDIGIIFIDNTKDTYETADMLELCIMQEFDWKVNKAYETKERLPDTLFVSNKNNVKGLEFPFVICVTIKINNSESYRNALYMMLTRSFITTYLLISHDDNVELIPTA
ncbi:MAG: DEAD/DEAH box helicase [Candidatus Electronema sp. V4]|uniref:DEAD/DEAH box helicase n=1 Tax=Candidatus Electronema sp. V4 TaxID=3454756 RepID=UPI0040558696